VLTWRRRAEVPGVTVLLMVGTPHAEAADLIGKVIVLDAGFPEHTFT
jgi:hypothetical protein